jgi:hypothetical protein
MNMRIQAVIDRVEHDKAVILLDEDEEQLIWPLSKLPVEAKAGHVLQIDIVIDEAATKQAEEEANALLKEILRKQAK